MNVMEQKDMYYKLLLTITTKNKIDCILETINKFSKNKRTPKFTNEYYLYYILIVLTKVQTWNSLNSLFNERINKPSKNHYKTIEDKHLEWSTLNIYQKAYESILENNLIKTKGSQNLNLFIDSSDIYNKNGCDNVGYGCNPKKKQTRISAICNENKVILSLVVINTKNKSQNIEPSKTKKLTKKEKENNKINKIMENKMKKVKKELKNTSSSEVICKIESILIDKNNTESNEISYENIKISAKKTLQHDSQTIEKTLDNLLINTNKCRKIYLIGDKGYMRSQKDKKQIFDNYKVEVVHPNKKNQKEQTSNKNKILLKKRYVIENVFANLKKFDRICVRKDKLTTTFTGFLFMATILTSCV